mmetsp:Transcript_19344/g.74200  ORF Transcript_19344/g.74200 Transcript_19344/m.74200 type:complete len:280 (+) Transcript_19344:3722-4561(+)
MPSPAESAPPRPAAARERRSDTLFSRMWSRGLFAPSGTLSRRSRRSWMPVIPSCFCHLAVMRTASFVTDLAVRRSSGDPSFGHARPAAAAAAAAPAVAPPGSAHSSARDRATRAATAAAPALAPCASIALYLAPQEQQRSVFSAPVASCRLRSTSFTQAMRNRTSSTNQRGLMYQHTVVMVPSRCARGRLAALAASACSFVITLVVPAVPSRRASSASRSALRRPCSFTASSWTRPSACSCWRMRFTCCWDSWNVRTSSSSRRKMFVASASSTTTCSSE